MFHLRVDEIKPIAEVLSHSLFVHAFSMYTRCFSRDNRNYFLYFFSFFLQDGSGRWVRSLHKGLKVPWGLISSVGTG